MIGNDGFSMTVFLGIVEGGFEILWNTLGSWGVIFSCAILFLRVFAVFKTGFLVKTCCLG